MHLTQDQTAKHLDRIGGCGTYEWDVVENRLVWSAGLVRLHGLDQPPTAEEGFIRCVHPDDRMQVEARVSAFLESGDTYEHEYRIQCPDGAVRHIHDRGAIERAADGSPLVMRGLSVDVTKQRQAQVSIQNNRLNTAEGIGFYEYDVSQRLSWWSDEMFRILDVDPSNEIDPELISRDRISDEDRARLRDVRDAASRRVGSFDIEYRFRRRDGDIRWIRERGETVGPVDPVTGLAWRLRGTITDITETRSVPARSGIGAETFQQVIERAPFGICVVDEDLRLVAISDGAAPAFKGIDPLLGRDYADLMRLIWPDAFADNVVRQFRNTLATGIAYHSPMARERRVDREAVEAYDWSVFRVSLSDGKPGIVCYFYDLSERAEQEAVLAASEERLQLAYDTAQMGAWDLNLATGQAFWTPQLYKIFDVDPDNPTSAELFFDLIHPDDRSAVRDQFVQTTKAGHVFDATFRVRHRDGTIRHVTARGQIVERKNGWSTRMIGVAYDVSVRRRMERQLRDSEKQLRLILDNAVAFIGVLDPDGTMLEVNAIALEAGGLERSDVVGKPFWETFWWSYDPDVALRLRDSVAAAAKGEVLRFDAVARIRDDARMTINVLLSPIIGEDGEVHQIVASGFDITDREKAMEHVQLLMREINHRSKNTISLILAVARQIWRTDPDDFLPRFQSRLQALASSHDLLVNDDWDGVFLEDLVRAQLAHFGDLVGTRIRLRGPSTGLTAEAAQALGMAFHELATNAGKYGALSNDRGCIDITWSVTPNGDAGQALQVSWVERDGPPVSPPARKGFGSIVLDAMVRGTLDGTVQIDFAPEGLSWQFTCSDNCVTK